MSQAGILNRGVFPPASVVETLTGNSGGAVGPDGANNINVVGDTTTIDVVGNPGTNTLTISTTDAVAIQYTTDAGIAVPATGNLNVLGGTAARDINTSGAGDTIHIDLDNAISLGDLSNITGSAAIDLVTGDTTIQAGNINLASTLSSGLVGIIKVNSINFIHSFGTGNTFVGEAAGNLTLTTANALFNTGIGYHCLQSLTDGTINTAVGISALQAVSTGSQNSAFGFQPLASLTTGTGNCAYGTVSLNSLVGGSDNICYGDGTLSGMTGGSRNIAIGDGTGQAYNAAQSDNILIGGSLLGDVADANTLRIGISGSGNYQQNRCFIAGIDGVNVGSTAKVVTMGTAGTVDQLGTVVITAGTGISVTPGANTISIAVDGSVVGETITGNSGGALSPTAGNWNIVTANSTPKFVGGGSTLTLDFSLSNLILGNNGSSITIGAANDGFGSGVLQSITSGSSNTAMGNASLQNVTIGSQTTAYGASSGTAINTGGNNTLIGFQSGLLLQSGNSNVALGYQSGSAWGAAVSNNIAIGTVASVADSARIRIGTNGTHTTAFIAGIDTVNVGSVAKVVTMASDQLGTATITAGTGITVTPGANTITISAGGGGFTWYDVVGGSATLAAESGYIADAVGLTTFTMPTNNNFGDTIKIVGKGSGGWKIVYGLLQNIIFGSSASTITTGNIASTNANDCVELICTTASITAPIFTVVSSVGNISIT